SIVPRNVGQFGGTPAVPRSNAPASAQITSAAPVTGNSRLVIEPDRSGHFRIEGAVDGRRLDFVIDTGASLVTLTESDAARLGFHPPPPDHGAPLRTPNRPGTR